MRDLTETMADVVARETGGGGLRILIVGAGLAGAGLAASLRAQGQRAALVERAAPGAEAGYMLGLLPLGGQVLEAIGLGPGYRAASVAMAGYDLYGRSGAVLRRYPLTPITMKFGDWRGIERGALLGLLRGAAGGVTHGVTITALHDGPGGVTAHFTDGSRAEVDLVVGADGVHSAVRRLILAPDETKGFDTGWGGHVLWSEAPDLPADRYAELWAAGWGIGLYPVPGRLGLFLAGRGLAWRARGAEAQAAFIAGQLGLGPFRTALEARDPAVPARYWKMADIRAARWAQGRVVLLGDAAASFLPTAGVGASAALASARALAGVLADTSPAGVPRALARYEATQRPHVERMQANSRRLARLMFVDSRLGAALRDQLMRFYSLDRLMADIEAVMEAA